MKVSFNPAISYTKAGKTDRLNQRLNVNPNQTNELQKNTMAELMGRCQSISFGAKNTIQGPIFEHTCKELLGIGEKDIIRYNKQNGCLKHEVYKSDGTLKQSEEFFPMNGSEIITTYDDYGRMTRKTTTPEYFQFQRFDEDGRETYNKYQEPNGYSYICETDYKRRRAVYREKQPSGMPELIKVVNLDTNETVTSGPMVIDKRFDRNSNTYITENILTKQVLQTEQKRTNGSLQRLVVYVEGSGLVKREKEYDSRNGGYIERIYSGYGQNNLTQIIQTSKDGRKQQTIDYAPDGKTVTSNVLCSRLRNGDIDSETVFLGGTAKIDYRKNYYDGYYTCTKYNISPNLPAREEKYSSKDDSLLSEVLFFEDGRTIHQKREYFKDFSYTQTTFDFRGKRAKKEYFESDDFLSRIEEYNTRTGMFDKVTEFDKRSGYQQVSYFDVSTGTLAYTKKYNRRGELEEQVDYFVDGQTSSRRKVYNFDGSYKETLYNTDGSIKSETEYDKYGNKKPKPEDNKRHERQYRRYQSSANGYNYSSSNTYQTTGTSYQSATETEDAFLSRIGSIAANKDRSIILEFRSSDWQRLAQILGIDNVDKIRHMDDKTYRQLAKSFHPDLAPHEIKAQARSQQLFQIINEIHRISKA